MDSKKPLILISNDDGYHSNGIRTLVSFLSDFAQVVVCAPEAARSGFSCAFSVVDYLLLKKRHNIPGCEVWSCTGTPVDCVKLALDQIFTGRPHPGRHQPRRQLFREQPLQRDDGHCL